MPEERIKKTLAELKDHPDLTEESLEVVQAAVEGMEAGDAQVVQTLVDRLEQRHPQLTMWIGRLAQGLAEMGF